MKTNLIIVLAIVAVLIIGGGIYFLTQSSQPAANNNQASNPSGNQAASTGAGSPSSSSSGSSSNSPSGSSAPVDWGVAIKNMAFNPATIKIHVGDSVMWINADSVGHTITSDSGTELASPTFTNGQSYSHTFTTAGTYAYHCSIHTSMKGTVIVS